MIGRPWSRDELLLAINLYCRTPFGKIHIRNPEILELAQILHRTPGSVSYKLANFASLDSSLPRKGAVNVSKMDREVWNEFFRNTDELVIHTNAIMSGPTRVKIVGKEFPDDHQFEPGQSRKAIIKIRIKQNFFRDMVTATYENKCCITGISLPELLIAGHIVPWSVDSENRLNPRNGILMNALHDRAFDKGLITLDENYRIVISDRVRKLQPSEQNVTFLTSYEGKQITLPSRFVPEQRFLSFHRSHVFQN